MSKISTYEVAPVPKLADKLIGTSVGGEIEDVTYNFTLQELLEVFLPVIPANNLQGILDYGNTATQDINLFGTITTTYLDVTDTATFLNSYFVGDTHIQGGLFDSEDSIGLAGQVLTSTGEFVEWVTLPPIFTPNLQQVLEEGNTSDVGIILDAGLEALDVDTDTATINTNITIDGTITDGDAGVGVAGSVLSSTVTGVKWVALPVYSATSPLLFNSATGVFSIQQATNSQSGYLSSSDWITFDGKQNAGNYITALTGEATASGPGSATVTLSNSAVIGKVLTGFNPTAGTINASDSILTAFGKTQSQINALVGGVQYQGTWNASANLPVLTSSVGVQGHYYVVNVAGNTNLNGITDWKIGDWAIFSESVWQKVDNTESVSSVNGFTGAVSLTTDDIPEGLTNLYFLNSRARAALSFLPGSGAYDNTSGAITIPTDNNQILNGAGYITFGSLSASSPLVYNNLTGAFSIPKATSLVDGYLSAADWSMFNGKQNYLGGTGLVKSTAGTISYITDNSSNWNTAYDRSIISAAVTGTTTKTLTLNEQDGNTITASWTDLDTGLTSVGVSMPGAFTVTNSPLTSNGTIAITGAGTTLQYIDGTGALQTFPTLTGYIPYIGATANPDLGEFGISAGYFQADLTPTGALQVGRMQWNNTDGTMDLRLLGNNVTLQIGQENVTRVVNKSGIDLLEANYQVVRVRKVAEGGAQGQRLAVVLAQGNNENNSTEVIGLVTETINSNQEGFVTAFGEVKNINTTGSLQGETWVDGDILYLSDTVPGQLTKVRPIAPNHAVIVGYVTYAHVNNGKIYMAIDTGYELGELHNVYAPSPTANQSIYWNVANSRYQLNTIGGILGYTPADAATTISTTAPLQGGGDLSANRTFSITQSGASTDGYLSSTDWNTFNNKQPAGSYVPTSRQLTINGTAYDLSADRVWSVGTVTSVAALTLGTTGTDLSSSVATGTTTPVITLNVPTASAANRGALSAADWSTFNTKVGSVTASSPLASSGGATPNITIQQSSGSQDGYLSSTDWTTFNSKQAAGNYITSLTGEATASGPGAAAVTLNNASVTGKVLTGVNITGGTVQATDTMLTAFGKLQNQINGLIGSTIYQGTWNASTNTPALASGVGVRGYYYIVSVAGTTNLDGISDWFVGDWAIFDGTAWQQVDNTDAVVSVNGQTGAVSLTTDNISEGTTNLYYLDSRARAALSFTAGSGAYNSTTGVITIPTNTSQLTNGANFITLASLSGTAPIQYNNTTGAISITQAGTASNGFLSSTDWNTFNNKQATITLTTTGSSGASTLVSNTLNVPTYTLAGLGGQPLSTNLTSLAALTFASTSFVKMTAAGTFALDTNTYALASALGNYLPLTAGITKPLTGDLYLTGYSKTFIIGSQSSGFDLYSSGNFAPHYVTDFTIYQGAIGSGATRMSMTSTGATTFVSSVTANAGFIANGYTLGASGQNLEMGYSSGSNIYIINAINRTSGLYDKPLYFDSQVLVLNNGSTGNVLIGTSTNAGFKLDVNGTGRFSGNVDIGTGDSRLTIGNTSSANTEAKVRLRTGSTKIAWEIGGQSLVDNALTITPSTAAGGTTFTTPALTLASTGAATFSNDLTIGGKILISDGGNATIPCLKIGSATTGISQNVSEQLNFITNSSTKMVISSGGDVAIGRTDFGGGRLGIKGSTSNGAANAFYVDNSSSTELFSVRNDGRTYMIGNVLIGTTTGVSGGGALQVNGNVNINGVFQINGVTIGGGGGSGVTGSGTTNTLTKWTGGTTLGNSSITDDGSVVSTSVRFSFAGDTRYGVAKVYNSATGDMFGMEQVGASQLGFTAAATRIFAANAATNFISLGWYTTATAFTDALKIQIGTGNVLINRTTDAGYKLDVNGGTRIQGNLRLQGSSIDSPILTIVGVTNTLITMGDSTSATTDIGIIQIRNGGTPVIQLDAGSGTNSYFNTGGGLLVNTIADAGAGYKLQVNGSILMTYASFFNFRGSSGAGDVLVDNSGSTLRITGNVTVAGSVTATGGFFDTSDSRLKIVIKDYNQAKGIEKVAAKFYVKNGRRELGYFAQDLQEILPSAVAEGADGFLTLSYSQVHTAKIAVIEDEVTILKNRVSELEKQLNLN